MEERGNNGKTHGLAREPAPVGAGSKIRSNKNPHVYLQDMEGGQDKKRKWVVSQSEREKEEISHLRAKVAEYKDWVESTLTFNSKRSSIFGTLLVDVAKSERRELRMKARQDSLRYGHFCVQRDVSKQNHDLSCIKEIWEEGEDFRNIYSHLRQLSEAEKAFEDGWKAVKERESGQTDKVVGMPPLLQDAIYQSRLDRIKKEEESIRYQLTRNEQEARRLRNELSHIDTEDSSPFNNFQDLNERYLLLNLLGRGGFGEVFEALDLEDDTYVACKLHRVKKGFKAQIQMEWNAHKKLTHNHIVRHLDSFKVDDNTFCSVLELCRGKDLAAILRTARVLPEVDAKVIIAQIFLGLSYLNEHRKKIIHYDLKPANVLFDELGVAKISDFGLSKVMKVGSKHLEVQSNNEGTYWYLPPECFKQNSRKIVISTKVDVWSAGVIFFEILFGRVPFGYGKTQEEMLAEGTILNALKVEFPCDSPVSDEAKDFIKRCLTFDEAERPDALTMANDPYLRPPSYHP